MQRIAIWMYALDGRTLPWILSHRVIGVARRLQQLDADVYIAHNIDMLLPAVHASECNGALLIFDAMEYYSDMGDGQTSRESTIIRAIERRNLKKCALTLASSPQLAEALAKAYEIPAPLALYNTPPLVAEIHRRDGEGLQLYWRNSVLGLGQRGLDDALLAVAILRDDGISLHLRGRFGADAGASLRARIVELGIQGNVFIHAPHGPDEAVAAASQYDVGLCLERPGIRNHELTVSNKLFDYMMGGLAVISSDLPGLRYVVEQSGAGLCYRPGSPEDLAKKCEIFIRNPDLRRRMSQSARKFALLRGNRDVDMAKFRGAFADILTWNVRERPQTASAICRSTVTE
jgi:glycosyltransferase involved in cell wall biosynthesis